MAGENIVAASLGVRLWMDIAGFETASKNAVRSLQQLESQLLHESRVLAMGADEARLYTMALQGVPKAVIDNLRAQMQANEAMRQQARRMDEAKAAAERYRRVLRETTAELKRQEGVDRSAEQLRRISGWIRGRGDLIAIGLISQQFRRMGESASEASQLFRSGQIGLRDFAGEMLRAIPILGDFTRGFDGLREAVTGELAAMAKIDEQAKLEEEGIAARIARRNEEREAADKAANEAKDAAAAERKLIDDLIGSLEKEARELNMTRQEIEEYALAQHDATDADRERLRAAFDLINAYEEQKAAEKELADLRESLVDRHKKMQADEMKAIEDRADEIARIEEQAMTEAERAEAEIERLQELVARGDISEETFRRSLDRIARQFRQPQDRADELLSGAQFGSRSAAQAALRGLGQRRDIDDVERDQLKEQKENNEILRRIERLLKSNDVALVGVDP